MSLRDVNLHRHGDSRLEIPTSAPTGLSFCGRRLHSTHPRWDQAPPRFTTKLVAEIRLDLRVLSERVRRDATSLRPLSHTVPRITSVPLGSWKNFFNSVCQRISKATSVKACRKGLTTHLGRVKERSVKDTAGFNDESALGNNTSGQQKCHHELEDGSSNPRRFCFTILGAV